MMNTRRMNESVLAGAHFFSVDIRWVGCDGVPIDPARPALTPRVQSALPSRVGFCREAM